MSDKWRIEKYGGNYSDQIWDDTTYERPRRIADVHIDGLAERLVHDHAIAQAARAYREAYHGEPYTDAMQENDENETRAALFSLLDGQEPDRES